MEPEKACPRCGRKIPWGQSECPFCSEHRGYFWSLRRNTFLALVVALLIILFALTAFVVHRYDATRASLAQRWYSEGEAALRFGRAEVALADFRNALVYSPDNPFFQLRLGQAFAATGRIPEARSRLLSLREREPGNGPVNLEWRGWRRVNTPCRRPCSSTMTRCTASGRAMRRRNAGR